MSPRNGIAIALALAVIGGLVVYFTTRVEPGRGLGPDRSQVDAGIAPVAMEPGGPEEPAPVIAEGTAATGPTALAPGTGSVTGAPPPELPTGAALPPGTIVLPGTPHDGTTEPVSAEQTARRLVVALERRQEEVAAQIATAERTGDDARAARLTRERDAIVRAITQARTIAGELDVQDVDEDGASEDEPEDEPGPP